LQQRFQQLVSDALGEDLERALDSRFDYQLAQQSIKFYLSDSIPSICSRIPNEVSEILFVSDLSRVSSVPIEELKAAGGIFRAACPSR
jgi:hypothetical protein